MLPQHRLTSRASGCAFEKDCASSAGSASPLVTHSLGRRPPRLPSTSSIDLSNDGTSTIRVTCSRASSSIRRCTSRPGGAGDQLVETLRVDASNVVADRRDGVADRAARCDRSKGGPVEQGRSRCSKPVKIIGVTRIAQVKGLRLVLLHPRVPGWKIGVMCIGHHS